MVLSLLPLLLLATPPAAAEDARIACAEAMTQRDINACAARGFAEADAALNAQWRIAIRAVRRMDEAVPHGDRRGTGEQRLREAQRAWILFRDAHCTVYGFSSRGGSMEPMLFNFCRRELTEERTRHLKNLVIDR